MKSGDRVLYTAVVSTIAVLLVLLALFSVLREVRKGIEKRNRRRVSTHQQMRIAIPIRTTMELPCHTDDSGRIIIVTPTLTDQTPITQGHFVDVERQTSIQAALVSPVTAECT
jgi:hypothetical protein